MASHLTQCLSFSCLDILSLFLSPGHYGSSLLNRHCSARPSQTFPATLSVPSTGVLTGTFPGKDMLRRDQDPFCSVLPSSCLPLPFSTLFSYPDGPPEPEPRKSTETMAVYQFRPLHM